MNEINKRVSSARRRLWLAILGRNLVWTTITCFVLCAIAISIPKIWAVPFAAEADQLWTIGWLTAAALISVLAAVLLTWLRSPRQIDAAIELDRRFHLKERLSSVLALTPNQLESDAGQALVKDAQRRAETIDVRDQFGFRLRRVALIPLLLILSTVAITFIPDAATKAVAEEEEKKATERKVVKTSIEQAKKKLTERMKQFDQKGLDELKPTVDAIDRKLDKLQRNDISKKDALVELNNIQKEIADKKDRLGDVSKLKKQLSKLSSPNDGIAKDFSDAMKKGDFKEAQNALKKLADKIDKKELTDKQKKDLAKQLNTMASKLNEMAKQQQQQKQELERKIQQAAAKGDMEKAAQLQQKLDQMNKQNRQQQQMQQLAKNLQDCANCMGSQGNKQNGQPKDGSGQQSSPQMTQQQIEDAKQALEQMGQQLGRMEGEMNQMDALNDLSNQMSECKGMCQGNGQGPDGKKPSFQDFAKGRGPGGGQRGRSETDTGFFKSQVDSKVGKGETVITGKLDGPNRPGMTRAKARELVEQGMTQNADPLENQNLPKRAENQALEYFTKVRGGKVKPGK